MSEVNRAELLSEGKSSELEKMIMDIIESDSQAKKITEQAEKMRKNADVIILEKTREISKKVEERAAQKVKKLEEEAYRRAQNQLDEYEKGCAGAKKRLDQTLAENKEKWVGEIFGRVIEI